MVGRIMKSVVPPFESQNPMDALSSPPRPAAAPTDAPEYTLRVTGAVRLVLVINLGSFVVDDDADTFRHLRGSEAFAAALRELEPQAPFGLDEQTRTVEQDAYALRIVRSRLLYNHFFPTYRMAWDNEMRARLEAMGAADIRGWQRWTCRVRLTRNGLAVVTLERELEQVPLIDCTAQVLELPTRHTGAAQDQWALGMLILRAFLDSLGRQIAIPLAGDGLTVNFSTTANVKHTLRLDRYVIYTFRKIEQHSQLLQPDQLRRDYAPTIASFMEGALVECECERRYPRYATAQARALVDNDVSSWDEELCLFTGESALIYCPLLGRGLAYVGGPMGLDAHAYGAYWAGIERCVEHLVAFRSEAQQAERRTTSLLGQIPELTRSVNDGNLDANDIAMIDHLAAGLSDIFDSLPEMRSMAVSTSAFRADYVRRKFEVLMRELAIAETLDLVNTNVEQLNFFLSYYNDMRLQWQGNRTNNLGVLLAVVVLFMAVSSFLADTFNVLDRLNEQDGWTLLAWIITVFLGILTMLLAVLWLRNRAARKQLPKARHALQRLHNR